jgi:hypothetical protein
MLQDVDELSQRVHVSQLHKARPQQVVQQLPQRLQQRTQRVTKPWRRTCTAASAFVRGYIAQLTGRTAAQQLPQRLQQRPQRATKPW